VVLHYFLWMPLPEVASALSIPLGTAKSRLHRAIGVLRATVEGAEPIDISVVPEGRLA
jgi:DNA-directed RNA polymerase specialized sigma24 family protein